MLISAVEHSSVLEAVPTAERIPVDRDGIVDLAALDAMLENDRRPALVSEMLANNETGAIQPLAEIVEIAHRRGAVVHTDAVQAAGKIPLDLGADIVTLSAHKIGGPPGIGAVVSRVDLTPTIRGGGQERGRRAGTENLVGIAGFAAAVEHSLGKGEVDRVRTLRDRLEAALPDAIIVGAEAPRLPNTSAIAMPGMAAETQVIAFDLAGIMVSAGAACSSGKVGPSHVLAAMGLTPEIANATIRVSLGWTTTEADIDHFVDTWTQLRDRRDRRRAA